MFERIRSYFDRASADVDPGRFLITRESTDHEFGESVGGIATIRKMKNGKFRLLVNQNEVIGTYARRRDAVRGATRKGLTVVDG